MSGDERRYRIEVQYCGSCNPQIDISRITAHLTRIAKRHGIILKPVSKSESEIDVLVILCGCPRACGAKEDAKARAKISVLIAGDSVNGRIVSETEVINIVESEVLRALGSDF